MRVIDFKNVILTAKDYDEQFTKTLLETIIETRVQAERDEKQEMLCEGDTRNRWRDGQVCPDVDKELWRLGPDGSGVFWRVMRQ
ncbi:hypothetical protein TNCV_2034811 [Trichonephila clavipes]|nr:hypothetical protein TNCV_2034811 [Trichonephila clavipes]